MNATATDTTTNAPTPAEVSAALSKLSPAQQKALRDARSFGYSDRFSADCFPTPTVRVLVREGMVRTEGGEPDPRNPWRRTPITHRFTRIGLAVARRIIDNGIDKNTDVSGEQYQRALTWLREQVAADVAAYPGRAGNEGESFYAGERRVTAIAKALGVKTATAKRTLQRLVDAGKVGRDHAGHCFFAARTREQLDTMRAKDREAEATKAQLLETIASAGVKVSSPRYGSENAITITFGELARLLEQAKGA